METAINVSLVEKSIIAMNQPFFVQNDKECTFVLISIPEETLIKKSQFYCRTTMQEFPILYCEINFKKTLDKLGLCGAIKFFGHDSKEQQEATLYYINSEYKIDYFETIYVPPFHEVSVFQLFKHPYKVLERYIENRDYYISVIPEKLINNNLYIYCKIVVKNGSILKRKTNKKLVSIYKEKLFTDFKIICQDQEFLVHKAVLAQSSPVFRTMFETSMKESKENKVEINNFEPTTIELMVSYMYSEAIAEDLPQETLKKLFMAAHMYQLEELKRLCLKKMCKFAIDIDEVLDLIVFVGYECREEMKQFLKNIRYTLWL